MDVEGTPWHLSTKTYISMERYLDGPTLGIFSISVVPLVHESAKEDQTPFLVHPVYFPSSDCSKHLEEFAFKFISSIVP